MIFNQCLIAEWCLKWRLSVNDAKSEIIHFSGVKKAITQSELKIGTKSLKVVSKYKYLGVTLDEHLKFEQCDEMLASLAGRALAKIISKFKTYKSITFNTFTKLSGPYETTAQLFGAIEILNSQIKFKTG